MNLILSFFLIALSIVPIISQTFSPKGFTNTQNSITFDWDINDPNYYTKWEITKEDGNKTEISFQCTNNATIKSCTYINVGTPPMNELYGISAMPCYINGGSEKCQGALLPSHYPTPIINSTIPSIPTDGTTITLVGSFIIFIVGNDSNYFQLSSGGIANFNTPIHLDPTQMIVNIPSGCGEDSFKWPSGSKLSFHYLSPTITSSSLSIDGNYFIVKGSNLCNKTNSILSVYLGGVLQEKVKIQSTSVELDVSQVLYTEILNFYINFGTSKQTIVNETIIFSPILYSVNSVPGPIGGKITINGKRLTTPPGIKSNIILGFESSWNITSANSSYILCDLQPGYDKLTSLYIEVANIMSSNNLTFNYNNVSIRSSTQDGFTITLYGDCFGSKSTGTIIYIGGTYKISSFSVSTDETSISFILPGNFSDNTQLQLTSRGKTAEYYIPLQLYVIAGDPISNSPRITHFKYFFLSLESMKPKIIINGQTVDGDDNSKELKDDGSSSYSFNDFPPVCGVQSLQYRIGSQSYNGTITSQPPIYANCSYSLVTNITTCTGTNFGGSYFDKQVIIELSNTTITPINITDTEFTFYTYDNYVSGHLTIDSCGASADLFYTLNAVYFSNVADGFHNNSLNDAVIINGKFFSSSAIVSIKCEDKSFPKCNLIDYKTISCPVQLEGPYDQVCSLNFDNRTNVPVYVTFQQPIALASNSLGLEGGELVIFGDSFYDIIDNIHIGSIQCADNKFISSSAIACVLPPITNKDLLNQLMFVNITIAGKSGGGYVFTYTTPWFIQLDTSSIDSMIIITTIIIAFAIASVYIQFVFLFYKKKSNRRVTPPSHTSKPINQRQQLTRQLTEPQFVIPQQTSSSRSNSISRY
ncbi:hypothetical protein ACTFIV_002443 [Dictyostelium citrinum]